MSNADFRIADCTVDGGYFRYTPTPHSPFDDWRGNCILVGQPSPDPWNESPVVEILRNELVARGLDAWGARLFGYGNGEVTIADNTITCASASDAGYAGGIELGEGSGVGFNRNTCPAIRSKERAGGPSTLTHLICRARKTPSSTTTWLASSRRKPERSSSVRRRTTTTSRGDVGAGIIDLGTGNVIEQ